MKGITPVVATILLLLITITIVGVTMVFFTRTVSTSTTAGGEQLNATTGQAAKMVRIDNAIGTSLTLRNTGTQTVAASELTVFVNNAVTSCATITTIAPGTTVTCTLGSSCTGTRVKVISPAGQDEVACS